MSAASSSSAPPRPLKRPIPDNEPDFFTPAASSFNPRPYAPAAPVAAPVLLAPTSILRRTLDIPHAGMDPLPTDPNVLFIHPPFTAFPHSAHAIDGLTYQLMADNPEWFLDPDDFNPELKTPIPYPPHLEPPRGWCPQKKKDLRDRGPDGWPEGEEPRLRCTFCRRTYAGVNAKSMWRRHVFEKHKVAMSNRRDNNDRPRGRGSNSRPSIPLLTVKTPLMFLSEENRQLATKPQLEPHDSLVTLDVDPQTSTDSRNTAHKSKFRSLLPAADLKRAKSPKELIHAPAAPKILPAEFPADARAHHHPLSRSHLPPPSPPLTPQSSDPANVVPESDSVATSSPAPLPTVPPSPYDPLLTPSFRHSPPPLPSEQPWRFPSPSHPLHSRSREISLSMLVHDLNSPVIKGSPAVDASPSLIQSSPMPRFDFTHPKRVSLDHGTPESLEKLSRPSPRALFSKPGLSLTGGRSRYRILESPLQRSSKTTIRRHKQVDSEDWMSQVSLNTPSTSTLDASGLLPAVDPFAIMWGSVSSATPEASPGNTRSSISNAGAESPVLRNSTLPAGVGLGIGLLGAFTLPDDDANHVVNDSDFEGIVSEEEGDEAEVASFLGASTKDSGPADACDGTPPPLKRRRMTIEKKE
ncbi:hypothetical protein C0991_000100 [Blastosporella zonata]|nr:hypothetical protein C0991_000100 [Blastosporella zonata]